MLSFPFSNIFVAGPRTGEREWESHRVPSRTTRATSRLSCAWDSFRQYFSFGRSFFFIFIFHFFGSSPAGARARTTRLLLTHVCIHNTCAYKMYKYSYRLLLYGMVCCWLLAVLWLDCGHRKTCQIPLFSSSSVVAVVVAVRCSLFSVFFGSIFIICAHRLRCSMLVYCCCCRLPCTCSFEWSIEPRKSDGETERRESNRHGGARAWMGWHFYFRLGANKWEKRTYFYCSLRSWLLFKYGWTSLFGLSHYYYYFSAFRAEDNRVVSKRDMSVRTTLFGCMCACCPPRESRCILAKTAAWIQPLYRVIQEHDQKCDLCVWPGHTRSLTTWIDRTMRERCLWHLSVRVNNFSWTVKNEDEQSVSIRCDRRAV